MSVTTETITIGGGCFWCVEAVYQRIPGVVSVTSGYAGGTSESPTYEAVCSGIGGHAEVTRIEYNPNQVSCRQLIDLFWKAHDPTTPNRQGADVGVQYRSIILYRNDAQRADAEASRDEAQKALRKPIVTTIEPLKAFYPAEEYHQDYYNRNSRAAYCSFVIRPKLAKLGMQQ